LFSGGVVCSFGAWGGGGTTIDFLYLSHVGDICAKDIEHWASWWKNVVKVSATALRNAAVPKKKRA